jgi:molybdate/tungstate transport system permease protein
LGLVILAFLTLPVVKMVVASKPAILIETIFDKEVAAAIGLTLYAALVATAIGFVFGTPLAYLLAKPIFRGSGLSRG